MLLLALKKQDFVAGSNFFGVSKILNLELEANFPRDNAASSIEKARFFYRFFVVEKRYTYYTTVTCDNYLYRWEGAKLELFSLSHILKSANKLVTGTVVITYE